MIPRPIATAKRLANLNGGVVMVTLVISFLRGLQMISNSDSKMATSIIFGILDYVEPEDRIYILISRLLNDTFFGVLILSISIP